MDVLLPENLDELIAELISRDNSTPALPYSCLACGMHFRDKCDITRHVEGKHVDLKFDCPYCKSTLGSRHTLKTHIRKKHKDIHVNLSSFN